MSRVCWACWVWLHLLLLASAKIPIQQVGQIQALLVKLVSWCRTLVQLYKHLRRTMMLDLLSSGLYLVCSVQWGHSVMKTASYTPETSWSLLPWDKIRFSQSVGKCHWNVFWCCMRRATCWISGCRLDVRGFRSSTCWLTLIYIKPRQFTLIYQLPPHLRGVQASWTGPSWLQWSKECFPEVNHPSRTSMCHSSHVENASVGEWRDCVDLSCADLAVVLTLLLAAFLYDQHHECTRYIADLENHCEDAVQNAPFSALTYYNTFRVVSVSRMLLAWPATSS